MSSQELRIPSNCKLASHSDGFAFGSQTGSTVLQFCSLFEAAELTHTLCLSVLVQADKPKAVAGALFCWDPAACHCNHNIANARLIGTNKKRMSSHSV